MSRGNFTKRGIQEKLFTYIDMQIEKPKCGKEYQSKLIALGLTNEQFAKLAGVSYKTVERYVNDENTRNRDRRLDLCLQYIDRLIKDAQAQAEEKRKQLELEAQQEFCTSTGISLERQNELLEQADYKVRILSAINSENPPKTMKELSRLTKISYKRILQMKKDGNEDINNWYQIASDYDVIKAQDILRQASDGLMEQKDEHGNTVGYERVKAKTRIAAAEKVIKYTKTDLKDYEDKDKPGFDFSKYFNKEKPKDITPEKPEDEFIELN